jgi:hypothetical protein
MMRRQTPVFPGQWQTTGGKYRAAHRRCAVGLLPVQIER